MRTRNHLYFSTRSQRALPAWLAGCGLLFASVCAAAGLATSGAAAVPAEHGELAEHQILVTIQQNPSATALSAGSTPRPYGGAGRYKATPRSRRTANLLAREYGLRRVDAWPIRALGVHCVVFAIPAGASMDEMLAKLAGDPRVESAQRMQMFEVSGGPSYDDPYLHLQHGIESMQVRETHRWAEGDGVTVAVVDSGVDQNHPELEGRIAAAKDFVAEGRRRPTADLHGTAVAGVIAAAAGNGVGIVGVAPKVRVMALKACWEGDEKDRSARCSSFTLAKAMAFVVDNTPEVMNLSLTGPSDPLLRRLIEAALDRGVVIVAADSTQPTGQPGFPVSVDGVIAVAKAGEGDAEVAVGGAGRVAPVRAPGEEILTLAPEGAYDFMSGSSFAAAHVSGIAALLLELEPRLDAARLRRLLVAGSKRSEGLEASATVVNACAALAQLVPEASCTPLPVSS